MRAIENSNFRNVRIEKSLKRKIMMNEFYMRKLGLFTIRCFGKKKRKG